MARARPHRSYGLLDWTAVLSPPLVVPPGSTIWVRISADDVADQGTSIATYACREESGAEPGARRERVSDIVTPFQPETRLFTSIFLRTGACVYNVFLNSEKLAKVVGIPDGQMSKHFIPGPNDLPALTQMATSLCSLQRQLVLRSVLCIKRRACLTVWPDARHISLAITWTTVRA